MHQFALAPLILGLLMLANNECFSQDLSAGKKKLPLAGEAFDFEGHEAFVIAPTNLAANTPWVWYAPTLPGLPSTSENWMFERFLAAGIAIAGVDVGESYGSPEGCKTYSAFYNHLVQSRDFSRRPVLLARSRGGLMLYNWAVDHADSVGGIAGIYPVCNIESYPGVQRASSAFGLTADQMQSELKKFNPIDRLPPLADARVPIFHIHGDSDTVVPLAQNSAILAERTNGMGGDVTLEVVAGQGHNMWDGFFQSEKLVRFVIASALESRPNSVRGEHPVPPSELWLTYSGLAGPGKGKHVVLIAAEQEYRSEQSMPMLAKLLSQQHGFDCTVLFSVNAAGEADPTLPAPFEDATKRHNIPGIEYLPDADCVIWLSRFMQLPDDHMQHFHDYFDSGKPLIALRTANHGFYGGKKYEKEGSPVSLRDLLGGTFMEHHGGWHRESTRGIIVTENEAHPILTGVHEIWGTSDVYRCHDDKFPMPADCTALVLGQPLINLEADAPANPNKEPLPIAWTKSWTGNLGRASKIFHFTMGSAGDFQNAGVRRLTVNAVYWGLGLERFLNADTSVDIVGDYQPLKAGFDYKQLGVKPHKPSYYR